MLSIVYMHHIKLQDALNINRGCPAEGLCNSMAISIRLYESPNQRQNCCHHTRHVLWGSLEILPQEESFTSKFRNWAPWIQRLLTRQGHNSWLWKKTCSHQGGHHFFTIPLQVRSWSLSLVLFLVKLTRLPLDQNLHPENSSAIEKISSSQVSVQLPLAYLKY